MVSSIEIAFLLAITALLSAGTVLYLMRLGARGPIDGSTQAVTPSAPSAQAVRRESRRAPRAGRSTAQQSDLSNSRDNRRLAEAARNRMVATLEAEPKGEEKTDPHG